MPKIDNWVASTPTGRCIVIGAGSLAIMVADAIVTAGRCAFADIAMVDDDPQSHDKVRHGIRVLGEINLVMPLAGESSVETGVVIAIARNTAREAVAARLPGDLPWMTVVHAGATVSPLAVLGEGTIVLSGCAIDPECTIGRHVLVNKLCSLGHNCVLEDFVQLAPSVSSGGIHARGSFTGMGANVLPGVRIGIGAIVGAGAMVRQNVPDGALAMGVPATIRWA